MRCFQITAGNGNNQDEKQAINRRAVFKRVCQVFNIRLVFAVFFIGNSKASQLISQAE